MVWYSTCWFSRLCSLRRARFCWPLAVLGALLYVCWPKAPAETSQSSTQKVATEPDGWVDATEGSAQQEEYLSKENPWFMNGGTLRPTSAPPGRNSGMWPRTGPGHTRDDRIVKQLMFHKFKTIYMTDGMKGPLNGLEAWDPLESEQSVFKGCPVEACKITPFIEEANRVDAIIFAANLWRQFRFAHQNLSHPRKQVWILFSVESPYHDEIGPIDNNVINWTATYRRDSDIVTPYFKYQYYDPQVRQRKEPFKNYAANKTKQIAWFVSNCFAKNDRLLYALELQKYITVDIYGQCSEMQCPLSSKEKCFQMLKMEYKFYLAFENSNCRDYITEKLFNSLTNDVLPIVMGAHPNDYKLSAPENSYIHVDDFESPKVLAEYLNLLDKNDELYNAYFKWKGTGEFINTFFYCRLCAMLHDDFPVKSYNIREWLDGPGACSAGPWYGTKRYWEYSHRYG